MFSRPERIHPVGRGRRGRGVPADLPLGERRVAFSAAARHIYLEEPEGPTRLLHPAAGARAACDVRLGRRGPAGPARLLALRTRRPARRAPGRPRAMRARPSGRASGRRERARPRLHRARPGIGPASAPRSGWAGPPAACRTGSTQRPPERRPAQRTAPPRSPPTQRTLPHSRSTRPRIRDMAESGAGTAAQAQERAEPERIRSGAVARAGGFGRPSLLRRFIERGSEPADRRPRRPGPGLHPREPFALAG